MSNPPGSKTPPRSTIEDFRKLARDALGSAEAARALHETDLKPIPVIVTRRIEVAEDLLVLLEKLELCRSEMGKAFAAKKPLFQSRGIRLDE